MKNKLGGLTTHWGGQPPTEEVGGGAAVWGWCDHPRAIWDVAATYEAPMGWPTTP